MFNKFFFISITTPLRTIYHIIQCFLVGMCMGDLFTMPLFALAHFYALQCSNGVFPLAFPLPLLMTFTSLAHFLLFLTILSILFLVGLCGACGLTS
jgi:hypothetical protein